MDGQFSIFATGELHKIRENRNQNDEGMVDSKTEDKKKCAKEKEKANNIGRKGRGHGSH